MGRFMSPEDEIYAWFAAHGHELETREHEATATVAEATALKGALPEGHSKSLLVKEKDGTLTLMVARGEIRADLKGIAAALGAKRFSFAPGEEMEKVLGVTPGSLTPLALINDREHRIGRVVIDAPLLQGERIWCHPLRNTASVGIAPAALAAFIAAHHGLPRRLDLAHPERDT